MKLCLFKTKILFFSLYKQSILLSFKYLKKKRIYRKYDKFIRIEYFH